MSKPKHPFLAVVGRLVWLLLSLLLLAATGIGYLAGLIHPAWFWWGGLAAILLPFFSGASLLVFLVLLVRYRNHRWLLALYAAVLILTGFRFVHPARYADNLPGQSDDLVVISLNLPRRGESEATRSELTGIVSAEQPGIIGIQESQVYRTRRRPDRLRGHLKLSTLIDSMDYRTMPPPVRNQNARWDSWHLPVLSTLEIRAQEEIMVEDPPPGMESRVYATRSVLGWQGRDIVHYNLHLWTYGNEKPWEDDSVRVFETSYWKPYLISARNAYLLRAQQAETLRNMIASETDPVIVSGDFNGTQSNWAFRKIKGDLRDTFALAGEGWGATYRSDRPLIRIDFILVDDNWEIVSSQVPKVSADLSDHRPVVARLRLKKP